jgi:REP element-mobilizing transposase RayT
VPHRVRPFHDEPHPVHVTLRAVAGMQSLRAARVFQAVRTAIARAQRGRAFRICHFSVQGNHIHMLVEAEDRAALSRGVQGLAIRLARCVNRVLARRGTVWADRFHAHALATPREVRNALVYVLNNIRKHAPWFRGLDPRSSARWFAGRGAPRLDDAPVAAPRTWLLRIGWARAGAIGPEDRPAPA